MKKIMLLFLLVGGSVFAQVKDTRKVADFSKMKVSQSIRLDFTYGKDKSVVVEVEDKEDLQYVKTEVSADGVLKVYIDQPSSWKILRIKNVKVYASNPTLSEVGVSSSANFRLLNTAKSKSLKVSTSSSASYQGGLVQTDNLFLESSSSSAIEGNFEVSNQANIASSSSAYMDINLKTNRANFEASSSSNLKVSGTANDVVATASSSASINGKGLTAKILDGKASSSGSIDMNVSEEIKGKASSSGRIIYTGAAKLVEKKVSSSGQIKKG
ncbi:MAG: DUF2807 domain-containing protein [Flavobacteriaceae bacterium]|jgi:hypothetical protein|nr:DUF2807 domain-containing protein [Flavobacteriaceae bacterium]